MQENVVFHCTVLLCFATLRLHLLSINVHLTLFYLVPTLAGSELPLLFGSADFFYSPTPAEGVLEKQLRTYWTNFAHGRVDNAGGFLKGDPAIHAQDWPAYAPESDLSMSLDIPLQVQKGRQGEVCSGLWDHAGYTKF